MLRRLIRSVLTARHGVASRHRRFRRLSMEILGRRDLFAGLPFGAVAEDTGEFMLGRIAVTPVFLESNGQLDPSTENWTTSHKAAVLSNIQTGLDWWEQLLATKSTQHSLEFIIDSTYVDTPFATPYEPIARTSNAYVDWVSRFLVDVGFAQSSQLETNMRAFNHAQRVKLDTDWSFTIFVVNAQNDGDGSFAVGGSFDRAFAFAGGLFEIVPSTRPASTFTHETGHMFWARDEYLGGGNYSQKRGYYNSQNTNAIDLNPNTSFVQADSIMSSGSALDRAYQNLVSPPSTLAQIGWVDSDADGIFDVLDVPLKLDGIGQFLASTNQYTFTGRASVQLYPNANSSGLQNDITLNRISRIEYRINGGNWQTLLTVNEFQVDLNLSIPIPAGTSGSIEIRAVESTLSLASNVFLGSLTASRDTTTVPGIQGFVWNDQNQDGQWQSTESGIASSRVQLVDGNRQPVALQHTLEPDQFSEGVIPSSQNGILIESIGEDTNGSVGVFIDASATTGIKMFRPYSPSQLAFLDGFRGDLQQLRVTLAIPTTMVSIDAVADSSGAIARFDAYNSDGKIIRRFQSDSMNVGDRVTLQVVVDTPTIAYVIARGYRNSKLKLDNLVIGPANETRTKSDGSFVLAGIPSGSYQVAVSPPTTAFQATQPASALRSVTVVAGGIISHSDFAFLSTVSLWQNPHVQRDANNDGIVSPLDALVIINEINRNGARPLLGTTLMVPPYYDVNGNREIDALDVLVVINFINSSASLGEGESNVPCTWFAMDWTDSVATNSIAKRRR